ncbi:amino acid adenylation domain-containing protein [Lentzea waywayandensis]|uniref:Amino acid adenylation domain-containing protein n=1 Tax=Lentzea waywayandensis TaxID=84724 RepID=A0A1I6FDK1_9PSEU|nr:non-ribosomal peptide synthetase [Lentzea waywayandensis]SFR28061.1 amino acid adenylation domain-containing protein [Lentzea waywayandensis]
MTTASQDTLHGRIAEQARRHPAAIAVSGVDGVLSYAELVEQAGAVAHRLTALGVGPHRPVGLVAPRSAALMVGMLGILQAGHAYLPLEPSHPSARLAELVERAGAVALVGTRELVSGLGTGLPAVLLDEPAPANEEVSAPPAVPGEALCYVLFTSGSTGRPKGVAVEHRQYLHYLDGLAEHVEPARSWALVSTFAADLGSTNVFAALTTGGTVHLVPHETATDSAALAAYLREHEVDAMKLTPSHVEALGGPDGEWLAAILPRRLLICAGEPLSWALVDRIRAARPGLAVQNHYGPTETTVSMLAHHVGRDRPDSATVPLGMPFRGTGVRVLGVDGEEVPAGVPGELHVHGGGLARGYLDDPGSTSRRFLPIAGGRSYRTGDLVRRLDSGDIEFLGRIDDQVKIAGFRVEPGEVRAVLAEHPAVRQAAVHVREDRPGRRQLVGYVTGPDSTVDGAELRRFLARRLPDHMVPAAVLVLAELPLTPNGKLDRAALPAPWRAGGAADAVPASDLDRAALPAPWRAADAVPAGDLEGVVTAAWRETLGADGVGPHDNFFDIGGNSLLLIQLRARLQRALGRDVRTVTLFRNPTVRMFVHHLAESGQAPTEQVRSQRTPNSYAERSRRRAALRRNDDDG